ncbi:MAG TPA: YbdK family carboxylate-amine ligase [Gaiellales bacterium]|nr:YbdK family carboxylate-amine ligase [Gaiellales bacterium]
MTTQSPLRRAFDAVSDLTVGAEEELLLLDPGTLEPAAAEWLLAELGESRLHRPELWSAQVELVTDVAESPAAAVAHLRAARMQLAEAAAGRLRIAGLGTHPLALPAQTFSPGNRYAEIVEQHRLGARLGALASGLHVHVAVHGADRALAVYNAMRGYAPLFTALAANAPFVAGEDTGLATVRPMLADALPRQGVGPRLPTWSELEQLVEWGRRTGAIPDPAKLWWECRLNLRLGTVELRAPDAQSSLDDDHALIALAHALVADLCERLDGGERPAAHDTLRIQENRWRAMRFGMEAELIDLESDRPVHARDAVAELVDRLARHAPTAGLAHVRSLAARDEPREQRRVARLHGPAAIVARAADSAEAELGMAAVPDGYLRAHG